MKKTKRLSEMSGVELAAQADAVEKRARSKSGWRELSASKEHADERAAWVDAHLTLISIRMPKPMLEVLKALAEREGIGYQTLIKRWLNERIELVARERNAERSRLADDVARETLVTRRSVAALRRTRR